LYKWKIQINTNNCTAVTFRKRREGTRNRLKLFQQEIPCSAEAKYLGTHLERNLILKAYVKTMENKAIQRFADLYSIF
jgi:hypothetical protein